MSDRAETCSWCDGDSCWVCGYADGREAAWPLNLSANLAAAGMAAALVTVLAARFGQLDDEARRMLGEAVS